MASLYNGSETRQTITARIDRSLLGTLDPQIWAPQRTWILENEGFAIPNRSAAVEVETDAVLVTAELGPGEVTLLHIGE